MAASVAQVANKESHQAGWPSEAAEVHMEIKLADGAAKRYFRRKVITTALLWLLQDDTVQSSLKNDILSIFILV